MGSKETDQDCCHVVLDNRTDQGTHAAICRSKLLQIMLASVSLRNTVRVSSPPPVSAIRPYLETLAWTSICLTHLCMNSQYDVY